MLFCEPARASSPSRLLQLSHPLPSLLRFYLGGYKNQGSVMHFAGEALSRSCAELNTPMNAPPIFSSPAYITYTYYSETIPPIPPTGTDHWDQAARGKP